MNDVTMICGDCGDDLAAAPGSDGNRSHLADGTRQCRSRAEANARRDWQGRPRVGERSLSQIADVITNDWRRPHYAAVPYIEAMRHLNGMSTSFGKDSADSIVRYFLNNAGTWRGERARLVKDELRRMLGDDRKHEVRP